MPTRTTCLTYRVETAKICNQSARFRLWWVDGKLEFFQPVSSGLDRNIGFYPHTPLLSKLEQYNQINYIETNLIASI